ncbi:RNase adapter RapZ [Alginatibacterium sediminis]|uniref:RNase adapter RapZ n=1 Tax=Alginatibacterium sediminis TaxID=2164068 RepID=A0A420E978_9ALTE|nr:RNase adapter RapZ [Alginatibacterium sediminis]RKF15921.1 RNase adapter RapZ [Alginatibacterium sediminis]
MQLIIVSGRSGSGKTVALRVLEDLGFYCVDNLPISLFKPLIDTLSESHTKVAVSVDARNFPKDPNSIEGILDCLCQKTTVTTIYLDAHNENLVRRYSETRRLHPLSKGDYSLSQAIEAESQLLSPLSNRADLRIDTSALSIHQLGEIISQRISGKKARDLVLVFESFGFKHGVPQDVDYVFDVRFLPNPHWIEDLRALTGLDGPVEDYLSAQPMVGKVIDQIEELQRNWLPMLEENNRAYVTIAIGCTGGQHRSVYITEMLAKRFTKDYIVQRRHRGLE